MKKISIKTFYLIGIIAIGLIGLAVGSTYAIFTTSAEISDPITINSNLTSNDDIMETFEVEIEPYKTVNQTININSGTISNVNYSIWYINNITDVDMGILSTDSKTTGTINATNTSVTSNIVLRNNSSEKKIVTVGIASSKSSIVLASNMTLVPQTVLGERTINTNAATYITKLYSTTEKSTVSNNSITYNTSPSQLLINDRKGSSSTGINAGNIRYYGSNPDNYVYFNCSNYNSPTSSTCELWRIIGVFDGKLKLIRNSEIGEYSWDNKDTTTGAESASGKNDWTSARLMKLLNPGYESETTGGSLYYNSKSGNCYAGQNNATKACNFTSTGIKNDTTRNTISETIYNLGGGVNNKIYPNESYANERGTSVYTGRPTTWQGKIALAYPSDYGYAVDLGKCLNKQLNAYNDSTCTQNNWMKSIFTASYNWLLNPYSGYSYSEYLVTLSGIVSTYGAYRALGVAPVVYLNVDTVITTGEGTKDSPYKIKYDDSVKGQYFNGTTDYKIGSFANYNFGKTITLISRFKIENHTTTSQSIVGNQESGGGALSLFKGLLYFEIYNKDSKKYLSVHTTDKVSLNKWHTAVGVYDGTALKLYLDGTLIGTTANTASIGTSAAPFAIGANPNKTGIDKNFYFAGYISDAIVIDAALSESLILSNYGTTFNRSYNNASTLFKYSTADTPYKLTSNNLTVRLSDLYETSSKTPVSNNSITYQYDTTNSLMKDNANNIRYYSASPKNYIYFNCSDYSNQTSSTCEKWRIIGVFDGKVKLMRNASIGNYSWDNKNTTTGAESAYGKNNWTDARLMKLLNSGYSSETVGGSLYYNAGSGTCYSGQNNATKSCNFTSIGIKNAKTRGLISDTTYYLGGHSINTVYPNEIYEYERGTTVYTGRSTTWKGKIALAYPSDYGYAADLSQCNQQLSAYNDTTCTSTNWMKSIIAPNNGWLLTPRSGYASHMWRVESTGFVNYYVYAYASRGVVPVLYLAPKTSIKSGAGTSASPYQLSVS